MLMPEPILFRLCSSHCKTARKKIQHGYETGPSRFKQQKSDRQYSADQFPDNLVPTNLSVFRAKQFNKRSPSILRGPKNLGEVRKNVEQATHIACFFEETGRRRTKIPPCRFLLADPRGAQ
jgi:hypothetical protein